MTLQKHNNYLSSIYILFITIYKFLQHHNVGRRPYSSAYGASARLHTPAQCQPLQVDVNALIQAEAGTDANTIACTNVRIAGVAIWLASSKLSQQRSYSSYTIFGRSACSALIFVAVPIDDAAAVNIIANQQNFQLQLSSSDRITMQT